MFEIDTQVEFKDPQARKWVPGKIVDEDNGFYEIEKPSGKVKTGIAADMVRAPLSSIDKLFAKLPKSGKSKPAAKTVKAMTDDPASVQFHQDLQKAYDYFNRVFFQGELPGVFWTTIQRRNVIAHFKPKAWVQGNRGNGVRDEFMINPDYLPILGIEDFLSSIAHEQVHQWQSINSKNPPRPGYHNEEFAEKMFEIGLQTSHNGKEGGKKTGQNMDHYMIDSGLFDVAINQFLKDGFTLSWVGANQEMHGIGVAFVPGLKSGKTEDVGEKPKPAKKAGTRAKFTCPEDGCKESAMSKPTAKLMCGEHKKLMVSG